MSRTNTGTGGAYGALNDYCRANRIKLDWTAVSDGPQNNVTWTATVMLRNDEAQRYIGQGGSKKAALAAASENPLDVEDVVAWSDGSAAYGALRDYCHLNGIALARTVVQESLQDGLTWTATVRLGDDEGQHYIGQSGRKRAALAAASASALNAEGVLWSDSGESST